MQLTNEQWDTIEAALYYFQGRMFVSAAELSKVVDTLAAIQQQRQEATVTVDGLLPCPFCGGYAYIDELDGYRPSSPKTYRATCEADCGMVMGIERETKELAAEWWNRRRTVAAAPQDD